MLRSTTGSDKQKHRKKSKSSTKSALPATGPVDTENKIFSATVKSTSRVRSRYSVTYADVVKTSGMVLNSVLLTGLPVLPVILLHLLLYQLSPLLVYRKDKGVDQTTLIGMMNLCLVWIPWLLMKKGSCLSQKKSVSLLKT